MNTTTCTQCGADALIWAEDGNSVKCDECGAFSERPVVEDFDRNHFHNLTGSPTPSDADWTPCTKLTHCPSICDCPVGGCDVAVAS